MIKPKKCPMSFNHDDPMFCLQDKCEWWDLIEGGCFARTLARAVESFYHLYEERNEEREKQYETKTKLTHKG